MLQAEGCKDCLCCPVCLDRLRDPVTIPCGHSYCMRCIQACWDEEELQKKAVSCPQCRGTFPTRPVLNRSTVLSEVVKSLVCSPAEPQAASMEAVSAGGECNFCSGVKRRAVKSCLTCVASFCEAHLAAHHGFPVLQSHTLVEASARLREKLCPRHNKLLEVFCVQDQRCICLLCAMDEHSGHTTVSAAKEWSEQQGKPLQNMQQQFPKLIQRREKELHALKTSVESYSASAQAAVDFSKGFLAEMTQYMEKKLYQFYTMIQFREKNELCQAEGVQKKLEMVIAYLKQGDIECSQLPQTDDPILCLQQFLSLATFSEAESLQSNPVIENASFLHASGLLSGLKEQMEKIFDEKMKEMMSAVQKINLLLPLNPKTRQEFKEYYCQLKLSPESSHKSLKLSEDNQKAQHFYEGYSYNTVEPHADRFLYSNQVLCDSAVRGCCYWEVKWQGEVSIALSYGSIVRNSYGDAGKFGYNNQSWSLECSKQSCKFRHNCIVTEISPHPSDHIGVYLDDGAGVLAFYQVCDYGPMKLLYRARAEFTKPLYPGFTLTSSSSVVLC